MADNKTFTATDYIVFVMTILVSLAIGLFVALRGRRRVSTNSYFLGERKLNTIPVALSYFVTFESSIMLLGFPAEVYVYGLTFIWVNVGMAIGLLLSTRITMDIMYPLDVTSVFEYFKLRYNNNYVRNFGVITGILSQLFYMGIVLFGSALAVESVTEFPQWATTCCFAVAATLYTTLGGMKAVIWTDVFQSVIMTIGMVAFLIVGSNQTGGFRQVVDINYQAGRLDIWQFDLDPTVRHTFWGLVIGTAFRSIYTSLTQGSVQRLNSTRSVGEARNVIYVVVPLFVLIQTMAMVMGLVAFGYHSSHGCDPMATGAVSNMNKILPYTMMELFGSSPGLPGLFIASLTSAALSTVSSGLSSLSANTCQDLVRPRFPHLSDITMTTVAKVTVIVYGMLSTGLAFMMTHVKGSLQQILVSFMSAIMGPLTGVFLMSIFSQRTTSKGALAGGIVGLVINIWISIGYNFSKTLPRAPHLPYGPTDLCYIGGNETLTSISYVNGTVTGNVTVISATPISTIQQNTLNETSPGTAEGVDKLYSLSYMYFSLFGALITIFVGVILSLLTKPQPDVNQLCILSVKRQFCCCFSRAKKWWQRNDNPNTVNEKAYTEVAYCSGKVSRDGEVMNDGTDEA